MLKDPKHPMTPGNITDDVSRVHLEGVCQIKCTGLLQETQSEHNGKVKKKCFLLTPVVPLKKTSTEVI